MGPPRDKRLLARELLTQPLALPVANQLTVEGRQR